MTVVGYVACDECNPRHEPGKVGTWPGTVSSAIKHGWIRVGGPSGGGSVPTRHYCPKCAYKRIKR